MVGLYPLSIANATVESPDAVAAFLSSESATIATTLPNFVLATPTYTTPSYIFNTSVTASVGQVVSTGLATSTYKPLLATHRPNVTALPTVSGIPNLATLVLTDSQGLIHTTTATLAESSVVLGQPPGWTSAATHIYLPLHIIVFSVLLPIITLVLASEISLL